ncbi:MAG TPA: FliI/YscN family ATPase [Pseudobdellovibrionaceae bacterium]|nr:FliI/YscN family ATPase [Pseudobdellovibrionaceae bacterium]
MPQNQIQWEKYDQLLMNMGHLSRESGKVTEVIGMLIKGTLPGASVGSVVQIFPSGLDKSFAAEVVGFKDRQVLMMPLGNMQGVSMGSKIIMTRSVATVKASDKLLGRIVDGMGVPIDGKDEVEDFKEVSIYSEARNPLDRKPIRTPMDLGIRAINGALTVGQGQRVAILAGSGVGKSVLLGMIARYTAADVNVIAMIGERGREVREFIENDLGPEGMKKSVVVSVTSDQSPLLRMRGAYVAVAISEYFSSMGKNVLLMMDSITRFSMAQREIGLSMGEPPSTKGYTPSVFSTLPKILERAGSFEGEGSITGLYTTLVESDDVNDPIGDAVRSIVDGHIVLSRSLAQKGHFPAIDILQSASRVMKNVVSSQHSNYAQKLRENLAIYREAEDLINIGAYKSGANPKIDEAIANMDRIESYLRQKVEEKSNFSISINEMSKLFR